MSAILNTSLNIGFVKLTDAAPYVIAKELGFFDKYALDVDLRPQNSWSTLRDKLEAGMLDAAQMLAPMPIASALGISGARQDIITPLVTSQNGNAITISIALVEEIKTALSLDSLPLPMPASILKQLIDIRKQNNKAKLRFASVFPFSCHYLQLLDYFAQGDIALNDVELLFIPPTSMTDSLASEDIDGFCVGGPYNASSVRKQIGATIVTSYDIWQDRAEKVLGITEEAYKQRPEVFHALCAAIIDACEWLKDVPNRFEAARILAQDKYLSTPIECIAPSLIGSCLTMYGVSPRHLTHYNRFSALNEKDELAINRPSAEQGTWLLNKIQHAWPHLCPTTSANIKIEDCFREDIFDQAVALRLATKA
ncbi:CmpA/NrtA family ABC transporter substrate-binding protein [Glaciecola sp. 2405UD65-10]|jgi:ABC-type nitrate/sulfonate/bicarbonate transport system substrate-binding protein|uniref:CmpA/NrtA family ABC transporter substrate-binding protein n=1 Tax=Glaciecola sp. 2405UD65-10 TaxID=3397244 RepID=UPI003B5B7CB7